jgi:hypothetical protein
MAGEIASLLLSRMTVPVVYFMMRKREARRAERLAAIAVETDIRPLPAE